MVKTVRRAYIPCSKPKPEKMLRKGERGMKIIDLDTPAPSEDPRVVLSNENGKAPYAKRKRLLAAGEMDESRPTPAAAAPSPGRTLESRGTTVAALLPALKDLTIQPIPPQVLQLKWGAIQEVSKEREVGIGATASTW